MVKDLKLSWALSFRALNKFFTPCPLVRSKTWPIKFLVPYCALYGRQLRISFSGSNSERTMSLPMTKSSGKNMYIAISNLAILNYWMQKYYRETLNHYVWCKSFLQPKQFVSGTLYCWESQALLVSIFMFAFNTEAMLGKIPTNKMVSKQWHKTKWNGDKWFKVRLHYRPQALQHYTHVSCMEIHHIARKFHEKNTRETLV